MFFRLSKSRNVPFALRQAYFVIEKQQSRTCANFWSRMSEEIPLRVFDSLLVPVSEADLIKKLSDTEDNFIERKLVKDHRGWLNTAVAFANSCPIGYPGVLFVGVDNNGNVERHSNLVDFEKLQKSISERISDAWPPIYHFSQTLKKDSAEFVAVLIPGSELRPHFAGHSYVRVGPETRKASEARFNLTFPNLD